VHGQQRLRRCDVRVAGTGRDDDPSGDGARRLLHRTVYERQPVRRRRRVRGRARGLHQRPVLRALHGGVGLPRGLRLHDGDDLARRGHPQHVSAQAGDLAARR
jgi:hypothetical protein